MIAVEQVDFIGVPVLENAAGDAWFAELGLWERNPRSTERWVEYEAPNVTLALVPNAYLGGRPHVPLPFGAIAVRVDDVDAERERLEGTGVEFAGDTFDSSVCNGAVLTGIDGNGMLLHRRYAPFPDGRSPDGPSGRIDFVAVPAQDRDELDRFYGDTLGLERAPHSSERWVEYETGNVTLALVQPGSVGRPFEPLPDGAIALRVADVQAAMDELGAAGVEFPAGLIDSGVCHIAPFSDPAGNGLMLHRRYAPFADGTSP